MFLKRKTILGSASLLLLLWLMGTEGIDVLAPFETALAQARVDPVFSTINTAFGFFLTFTHYILYIFSSIAGMLLDPTFLNLNTSGSSMGSTLLSLWQISRNLTNILLAFMLLIGAIMTIVFAEGGYVQKYAVKFVLAVLLVNFSWFFPRVVLDLTHVLTATIYSIPSALNVHCIAYNERGESMGPGSCKVVDDIEVNSNRGAIPADPAWRCIMPNGGDCTVAVKEVALDDTANTPNAIFGGLLWNHARLRYLTTLSGAGGGAPGPFTPPGPGARVPDLIRFTLNIAFVSFFSVMILFPLLALLVCLLIRIPIIWITVGFMPFMFIGFVAGDYLKLFNPMEIWNKFLHAAFLPVVVALPFSIGFLMINVASANPPTDWDPLSPLLRMMPGGPMLPGVGNLWQLIWAIMAAMVVWMGAKQAFKIDAIFEKFAAPIMAAGGSWGKLIAKLPLLLPLPLPGAPGVPGGLRLGHAVGVARAPDQYFLPSSRFSMPTFGGGGAGGQPIDATGATNALRQKLDANNQTAREQLHKLDEICHRLSTAPPADHARISNDVRQALDNALGGDGRVKSGAEMQQILRDIRAKMQEKGISTTNITDANIGRIRD